MYKKNYTYDVLNRHSEKRLKLFEKKNTVKRNREKVKKECF